MLLHSERIIAIESLVKDSALKAGVASLFDKIVELKLDSFTQTLMLQCSPKIINIKHFML